MILLYLAFLVCFLIVLRTIHMLRTIQKSKERLLLFHWCQPCDPNCICLHPCRVLLYDSLYSVPLLKPFRNHKAVADDTEHKDPSDNLKKTCTQNPHCFIDVLKFPENSLTG